MWKYTCMYNCMYMRVFVCVSAMITNIIFVLFNNEKLILMASTSYKEICDEDRTCLVQSYYFQALHKVNEYWEINQISLNFIAPQKLHSFNILFCVKDVIPVLSIKIKDITDKFPCLIKLWIMLLNILTWNRDNNIFNITI